MADLDLSLETMTFDSTSLAYSLTDTVTQSQRTAGVGESAVPTAPTMQRYSDEEMMDCPVEQCLTAQWDLGDAVPGSFDSSLGTHYFYTEPTTYEGEPGNVNIKVKKFSTPRSTTVVI